MKEALAEKLLAKVLGWGPTDVAKERPRLQAMASFKYDSYEQFSPGLRFLEILSGGQFRAVRGGRLGSQSSVRNGAAGSLASLYKLQGGLSAHP